MPTNLIPSPKEGKGLHDGVVLSADKISKKFCRNLKRSMFYGMQDISKEVLGISREDKRLRKEEFWALDNVSFQLRQGEALGLVGKNGSGKSTLLRMIAGLIKPDNGKIVVKGRVAPLIALGAGFNPILTGRENIYTNMAILGLTRQEIDERFKYVIEFAEIGDAIDAPVQSYSSGMAARLGFSCAIHTDPDILLIDEVLAVGDAKFRAKCYARLHELRKRNTSFILVSHNPIAILNACDYGVFLSKGKVMGIGTAEDIILKYEESLFKSTAIQVLGAAELQSGAKRKKSELSIVSITFKDDRGEYIEKMSSGQALTLCITFESHKHLKKVNVALRIQELGGETGTALAINGWKEEVFDVSPGRYEIQMYMPYLGLKAGMYSMKVNLKQESLNSLDVIESFLFKVDQIKLMSNCKFYQPRQWKIIKK